MENRLVTIIYFAGSAQSFDLPSPTMPTLNNPPDQGMFHTEVAMEIPGYWFEFGVQVGIKMAKLNEIEQVNNRDHVKCFLFVLNEWEELDPASVPFTWKSVIQILLKLKQKKVAKQLNTLLTN